MKTNEFLEEILRVCRKYRVAVERSSDEDSNGDLFYGEYYFVGDQVYCDMDMIKDGLKKPE